MHGAIRLCSDLGYGTYWGTEVEIVPEGQLDWNDDNAVDKTNGVDHQYACRTLPLVDIMTTTSL
jgi:hypothetical protein